MCKVRRVTWHCEVCGKEAYIDHPRKLCRRAMRRPDKSPCSEEKGRAPKIVKPKTMEAGCRQHGPKPLCETARMKPHYHRRPPDFLPPTRHYAPDDLFDERLPRRCWRRPLRWLCFGA